MKPLGQLPDGAAVFIDANIFVLAGSVGPIGLQCQELLSRVRQGLLQGFTATFVVAEVTHRVMVNEAREQLQRSARETVEYLQQNLAFIRSLKRHLMVASDIGNRTLTITAGSDSYNCQAVAASRLPNATPTILRVSRSIANQSQR
jgi:predicted nucleic acid-binding protein